MTSQTQACEAAGRIGELFDILDCSPSDHCRAAASAMSDYGDTLIAVLAERHRVDLIVARNKKDFAHSPVPALTPAGFVDTHKLSCLSKH